MKRTLLVFALLAIVVLVADSKPKPKPPPGCGYDSNGTKICCAATGMGGYCWPENWTPVQDPE